jgi:hypothetical protein
MGEAKSSIKTGSKIYVPHVELFFLRELQFQQKTSLSENSDERAD